MVSEMAERSSNSSVSPARSTSSTGSSFRFPAVDDFPALNEVDSRSRRQSFSRPKRDSLVIPAVPSSVRSHRGSRSRESSPARSCASVPTPRSNSHLYDRDSKQNLVTKVEPEVTALIGEYYAEEKDYRPNQKGRWGPPVLRGDDVLFIPAKKTSGFGKCCGIDQSYQSDFNDFISINGLPKEEKASKERLPRLSSVILCGRSSNFS